MSKKDFTIALDCDGVMCSFTGGILKFVNKNFMDHELTPLATDEHIRQWNVSTALGLSKAEDEALVAHIKTEGFCAGLDMVPGTLEAVTALREFARVICVTSPYPSKYWEWERRQWLGDKLGFQKKDTVFADDKNLIVADVLLDDKLDTILAYTRGEPVLLAQPWNQSVMQEQSHLIVHNWSQFLELAHVIKDGTP